MGFWEHAFDSFSDNLAILGAVVVDVAGNTNPFSEQFLSGDAHATAAEVESQLSRDQGREYDLSRVESSAEGGLSLIGDAASQTGSQVGAAVGETLATAGSAAGKTLDALTNPWVLGALAVVVVGVLVAPYAIPAIKAATT